MNTHSNLHVYDTDAGLYAELARFAGTKTYNNSEWVELELKDGGRKIVFFPPSSEEE